MTIIDIDVDAIQMAGAGNSKAACVSMPLFGGIFSKIGFCAPAI
jgi:hypothetical protein